MAGLAHLPDITLTQEQIEILSTCQPPQERGKGQLVRVTAAAGTGKTTTLLSLALRAIELGHQHITYLTFTKASAIDGTRRLEEALKHSRFSGKVVIDARTMHSCAHRQLNHYRKSRNPNSDVGNKIFSEKYVKKWISQTLNNQIEDFLEPCLHAIQQKRNLSDERKNSMCRTARDRVEFFLYKTLKQFCMKSISLGEFQNSETFGRDYLPAKLFHQSSQQCEKLGFNCRIYKDKIAWYANQASQLWDKIVDEDVYTFDFMMKRAQLLGLQIPGSILLVDESQDCDSCQVNWVAEQQVKFAKHVYVVGDAAQSIYGFRGAKSEYLMGLSINQECFLTESWRFGTQIANIANLILFAKEKSDQTCKVYDHQKGCEKDKNWTPYRVKVGVLTKPSEVTSESILENWRDHRQRSEKITLIARQNKTLFSEALLLIGFTPASDEEHLHDTKQGGQSDKDVDDDDEDYDFISDDESDKAKGVRTKTNLHGMDQQNYDFPRIHINGYGESSGRRAWISMFKVIGEINDLYTNASKKLSSSLFPEFAGREMTWSSFYEDVRERELNKYSVAIQVVTTYGNQTMAAVEHFRKQVIEKSYSVEEADIILTTCHAAKGMEWDHVLVANDFIELANYKIDDPKSQQNNGFQSAAKKQKLSKKWKFGFPSWGDDVNLAYVACTRAKKSLSLPPCMLDCIRDFDSILGVLYDGSSDGSELPVIKGLEQEQVGMDLLYDLYDSLIRKFREEIKVPHGCPLIDHLVKSIPVVGTPDIVSPSEVDCPTPVRAKALIYSARETC